MTTTPAASALTALDADDFTAIIRANLGSSAPAEVWDALTDPAVIDRTRLTLGALHTEVQNQITLANADLQQLKDEGFAIGEEGKRAFRAARAAQADWRRKATYFRQLVERRIAFVKARVPREAPRPAGSHSARRVNQDALERLARAVAAHRDKVLSGEGAEEDDDALWDCLDNISAATASGGEMTLTEWLDRLDSLREAEAS